VVPLIRLESARKGTARDQELGGIDFSTGGAVASGTAGTDAATIERDCRVARGFAAAARRFLVVAAFRPAARRFRVLAAFAPAARRLRVVAFRAAALRFRVVAAFFAGDGAMASQCSASLR
jgi:hypothetical protein